MNTQASSTAPVQSDTYREPLDAAANAMDMACLALDQLCALLSILVYGNLSPRSAHALTGLAQYLADDNFDILDDKRREAWAALGQDDDAHDIVKVSAGPHGVRSHSTPEAMAAHAVFQNSPGTRQTAATALEAGIAAVQQIAGLSQGMAGLKPSDRDAVKLGTLIRDVELGAVDAMHWELLRQRSAIATAEAAPASAPAEAWASTAQIASAMGTPERDLHELYERHAAQFQPDMTKVVDTVTSEGVRKSRIFSPAGLLLLAMLAKKPEPAREKEGSEPSAAPDRLSVHDLEDRIYDVQGAVWGASCAFQQGSAPALLDACLAGAVSSVDRLKNEFQCLMAERRAHIVLKESQSKTLAPNSRRFDLRVTDTGADLLLLELGKVHSTIAFSGPDPVMDAERAGREWLRGADVPAMARKAA